MVTDDFQKSIMRIYFLSHKRKKDIIRNHHSPPPLFEEILLCRSAESTRFGQGQPRPDHARFRAFRCEARLTQRLGKITVSAHILALFRRPGAIGLVQHPAATGFQLAHIAALVQKPAEPVVLFLVLADRHVHFFTGREHEGVVDELLRAVQDPF